MFLIFGFLCYRKFHGKFFGTLDINCCRWFTTRSIFSSIALPNTSPSEEIKTTETNFVYSNGLASSQLSLKPLGLHEVSSKEDVVYDKHVSLFEDEYINSDAVRISVKEVALEPDAVSPAVKTVTSPSAVWSLPFSREAVFMRQDLEDALSCSICFDTFNGNDHRPSSLTCGHTFCEVCINRIVSKSKATSHHCPVCKQEFVSSTVKINFGLLSVLDQLNNRKFMSNNPISSRPEPVDLPSKQAIAPKNALNSEDLKVNNKVKNQLSPNRSEFRAAPLPVPASFLKK